MHHALHRIVTGFVMLLVFTGVGFAGEWPQFLGPNRDAVSTEKVAAKWPAGGPKVKWSIDVGPGFGGAAIRDGKVFILDRVMDEADVLRVLDLNTGKELWSYRYDAKGRLSHYGSRSVPTVDDEAVYTVGGFGNLYCISRKTHQPLWHVNLAEQYPRGDLKWGFAQSPLLYKGMVIAAPTKAETPGLVAFDAKTGKVVWESEAFGGDYYVSPIIRTVAGKQGIMQLANKVLAFVDPDTGKTLWKYEGYPDCNWPIPAPTVLSDGQRIFVTGGYDAGSVMIRVTSAGDSFKVEELFRLKSGAQIHPAIEYDGFLYANINENATLRRRTMKDGGFACIDPNTGKIIWRTGEDPNMDRGAVMLAGDRFIVLDGQNGDIYLIKPDSTKYNEVSRAKVFELDSQRGNDIWAPMALSDGLLVIRNQKTLKCLEIQ
ncbi:PQQ-binding-like beta-propeller repeat protein [Planctomycetales bacterium ZRK34]|nr:PQQ-binding-like beta-propeller repeat protein [Planctomycetales bacterium ZRK34]